MNNNQEIPNNWTIATIKDLSVNKKHAIVDGPFGTQMKAHEFVSSGIPVIEMQNIDEDKFINNFRRFITKEKFGEVKRSEVIAGDILISKTGSLGYVAIVPSTMKQAIITSRLAKISIDWRFIVKNYLLQYLLFLRENGYWQKIAKGTTMKILNVGQLADTEIPLPPLPEQQRIVARIEELFSSLDKGIESLKTAQQQLKIYRQSVLKWAFEGKLTNSKLKIVKLGDHADLITKGASPRWQGFNYIDDQNQLLFITSENIRENFIDLSKTKYLSLEINKILKRSILKKEDVLFNLVGASIGRAAVFNLDKIANINQAVAVIRLKETIFNRYLSLFLNSEVAKQKYLEKIVDVARANLSLTDVANIAIPLPFNIEEQHAIVAEIESRLSVCDKIEESIEESLKQAEALRQSILKKAFEGKLVPQDHNDEPASKLLERIKAEKEKTALKKRSKN